SFIQLTLFHSIPFLCVHALGCSKPGLIKTLCTQGALFLSVSSLPLPGAAGVTEYGYALFYADMIPAGVLGSAILLSRFCSLVFPLVFSGLGLLTHKKG
ncbi:MAG: lysylphosphatidylglycerol synthase domain-containing protein, partial [Lachnospiraceae bacterium]|nr:lysylphosphatidylglycerol synthase domain-containing protein [Lachnospiraceae bacterium]